MAISGELRVSKVVLRSVDKFLFDLDGTVTRRELLPFIAEACGVGPDIEKLTQRTIRGDVPFEASLQERVAILGRFSTEMIQGVVASVDINPDILNFLHQNKDRCAIVTGNLDAWLVKLARQLPVPVHCSHVTVENDQVVGFKSIMDKRSVKELYPGLKLCAIGEGHNDLGMFEASDYAVAYGGVHAPAPSLLDAATHAVFDAKSLCRLLSQF